MGSLQRRSQFSCKSCYSKMLDAKIPVPVCLKPKMTVQLSERRSGGTGSSVCSRAGRCKLISAPSLQSALHCTGTAVNQRRCDPLLAGCVCGGVSLILAVTVQLLLGHRWAWPGKFTPNAGGKTAESQTWNTAQFPNLGSILQLINPFTPSSVRTLITLRKIIKIPGFYCIGCRGRTVCFNTGVHYPLSIKYLKGGNLSTEKCVII